MRITDLVSGRTLLDRAFDIAANARTQLGRVPFAGQGLLLIDYEIDGKAAKNHYLYGEIPFRLDDVVGWLRRGCYAVGIPK